MIGKSTGTITDRFLNVSRRSEHSLWGDLRGDYFFPPELDYANISIQIQKRAQLSRGRVEALGGPSDLLHLVLCGAYDLFR